MERTNNVAEEKELTPPRYVATSLVASDFSALFLDGHYCRMYFLDNAHGRGAHCPDCGEAITDERQVARYYSLKKFTCKNCKQTVSAKKGTVLENCSLTPRQYILLALFLEAGFSDKDIGEKVGIHAETVRLWKGKLNV